VSVAAPDVAHALAAYVYELPDGLIAREPGGRGASRLLVLDRATGAHSHHAFADLPGLLPPGALLVANNSRVVPARLIGARETGGRLECLLLTPLPLLRPERRGDGFQAEAQGLIKPARSARPGFRCSFADGLAITVLQKKPFGRCRLLLEWNGDLLETLEARGHLPLPPYMRRAAGARDAQRYQTVYARRDKSGSVAAPTAGLHFTAGMREELIARGFGWEELTLHVGYDTFSPVREQDIRRHAMHGEYGELSPETALAVSRARREGRPVIAVGTTTARTLEGVAALHGGSVVPHSGWISLFIRPGFTFQVVSGLVTNFHLPGSTLLMLVSALAGRERVLAAYARAVAGRYAFFSYGDAMLIV
jgi:S-adenosylmethionine:tRNA ribosyltransferase-isomerase